MFGLAHPSSVGTFPRCPFVLVGARSRKAVTRISKGHVSPQAIPCALSCHSKSGRRACRIP